MDGQHLPVAFMDMSKAFDNVWHDGLLYKLFTQKHVSGFLLRWIAAFLRGRSLRVIRGALSSDWHPVKRGVPQGTISSPGLFLVYVDDLPAIVRFTCCLIDLLADDATLCPKICGPDGHTDFSMALRAIYDWSVRW